MIINADRIIKVRKFLKYESIHYRYSRKTLFKKEGIYSNITGQYLKSIKDFNDWSKTCYFDPKDYRIYEKPHVILYLSDKSRVEKNFETVQEAEDFYDRMLGLIKNYIRI